MLSITSPATLLCQNSPLFIPLTFSPATEHDTVMEHVSLHLPSSSVSLPRIVTAIGRFTLRLSNGSIFAHLIVRSAGSAEGCGKQWSLCRRRKPEPKGASPSLIGAGGGVLVTVRSRRRRCSRNRRRQSAPKPTLSLNPSRCFSSVANQDFILRARVLKLYRQALRIASRAPSHGKVELRQTIRQEMEKHRSCEDKQRVRFLISEGLERLKALDEMLDMQGS